MPRDGSKFFQSGLHGDYAASSSYATGYYALRSGELTFFPPIQLSNPTYTLGNYFFGWIVSFHVDKYWWWNGSVCRWIAMIAIFPSICTSLITRYEWVFVRTCAAEKVHIVLVATKPRVRLNESKITVTTASICLWDQQILILHSIQTENLY